jgi:hypothetical protein
MPGGTGGIRSRAPSACNGYKTLGSVLVSDNGSGAGSVRRMFAFYAKNGQQGNFYNSALNLRYGQYRNRSEWFLKQYN